MYVYRHRVMYELPRQLSWGNSDSPCIVCHWSPRDFKLWKIGSELVESSHIASHVKDIGNAADLALREVKEDLGKASYSY